MSSVSQMTKIYSISNGIQAIIGTGVVLTGFSIWKCNQKVDALEKCLRRKLDNYSDQVDRKASRDVTRESFNTLNERLTKLEKEIENENENNVVVPLTFRQIKSLTCSSDK